MTYLFSRAGLSALRAFDFSDCLIALDFDGTLAPIVSHADDAFTPENSLSALRRLAKLTDVTIISGRSRADLAPRLRFKPQFLVGNHGLEAPWNGKAESSAARNVTRWADQLDLSGFAEDPGVFLENKQYSLSLHYRRAKHPASARRRLWRLVEGLKPAPRVVTGKCLLNLTTAGAPNKGHALLKALEHTGRQTALFVGDDDTDEDIFRLRRSGLLNVRVGLKRASKAKFYLRDQGEVARLLNELVRAFETVRGRGRGRGK